MLERKYQPLLIKEIRRRFPGCVILKNDPVYMQGVPDLTVLHQDMWAMLEDKGGPDAPRQPNQEYYVRKLNEMSFAAFIDPSNESEVLDDLERTFRSRR